MTGTTNGVVILWNRSDQIKINSWETNHPIVDCQFSNDGSTMSWIGGGSLYLRNHDTTQSYFGQYDISPNGSQLSFLPGDYEIAILSSEVKIPDYRRIDFINYTTMPIQSSRTLFLGHNAVMMAIHPFENTVAISTLSLIHI